MKLAKIIFIVFCGSYQIVFSQIEPLLSKVNNIEAAQAIENYKVMVKNFGEIFENNIENKQPFKTNLEIFNIKTTIKTYLKAYNANPLELKKIEYDDFLRVKREAKGDVDKYRMLHDGSFGVNQHKIKRIIEDSSGNKSSYLILTDLILRGKILEIRDTSEDADEDFKFLIKLINIEIEDYLKGNNDVYNKKIITIFYNPRWINNNEMNYEVGLSYLFNLQYLYDGNRFLIGIITGDEKAKGYFPIINNELIDKTNWYGMGEKIGWNTFRNEIIYKINTLLN